MHPNAFAIDFEFDNLKFGEINEIHHMAASVVIRRLCMNKVQKLGARDIAKIMKRKQYVHNRRVEVLFNHWIQKALLSLLSGNMQQFDAMKICPKGSKLTSILVHRPMDYNHATRLFSRSFIPVEDKQTVKMNDEVRTKLVEVLLKHNILSKN